jgi:hypothetical protein
MPPHDEKSMDLDEKSNQNSKLTHSNKTNTSAHSNTNDANANNHAAVQDEIARLQALLMSKAPKGAAAPTTATTQPGAALHAPASGTTINDGPYITDLIDLRAWLHTPIATLNSTREYVRECDMLARRAVVETVQYYLLIVFKSFVYYWGFVNSSWPMSELMTIPYLRTLIVFYVSTLLFIVSSIVNSRLFTFLPFSDILLALVRDPELNEVYESFPPLPVIPLKPFTKGPLRPFFRMASYLPFSSCFFRLDDESSSMSRSLSPDHPVVAALLASLKNQSALIAYLEEDRRDMQSSMAQLRSTVSELEDRLKRYERLAGSAAQTPVVDEYDVLSNGDASASSSTTNLSSKLRGGSGKRGSHGSMNSSMVHMSQMSSYANLVSANDPTLQQSQVQPSS